MLRSLAIAILAFTLLSASVAADFSLGDWRYVKTIALPSSIGEEGLVELLPDRAAFAGSTPGLVDLRIIAGDGTEVPYAFEVGRGERQRTSLTVALQDVGYVPGQYTTFVIDLGQEGLFHNEVEFQTPATDFRRTATVETSSDGTTWAEVADQEVYAFTVTGRAFTTRNTSVRYVESTARYLRVRISDEGEGALEVTSALVFFTTETPPKEVPWAATIVGTSADTERLATLVDLDLGSAGIPTNRLDIRVSDVNFYREVALEQSVDREEWRALASRSPVFAYDTTKFTGSDLALTYPETTARYLRLVIHDEDSPPLSVQGVDTWGLQRRLAFSATPQQSYALYYGNSEARRPSYDIERVFPYLETEGLAQVELGPQADNPGFVEKEPPKPPFTERFPWLLPTVIALAGVVLAALLFGILRQAKGMLPPPPAL